MGFGRKGSVVPFAWDITNRGRNRPRAGTVHSYRAHCPSLTMLQSKVQAELGSLEIVPLFTSAAKHTIVQITILLLSGYGNTIYRFMACKGTLSKA